MIDRTTEDPAPYGANPARAVPSPPLCRWRIAGDGQHWTTSCHYRIRCTREDSLFAFCPYCGNRLLIDRSDTTFPMPAIWL